MTPEHIYADGGVIGRQPSRHGGTWCWLWVDGGEIVRRASGVITPIDMGGNPVTNNETEALAAVRALESAPAGWRGTLFTDSWVTVCRLTTVEEHRLPPWLRVRVVRLREGRRWEAVMVGGHPTAEELKAGFRTRNNLPVSRFNVWADNECSRLAREFREKLG